MQLSLLARQYGLNCPHPALMACKRQTWAALCGSSSSSSSSRGNFGSSIRSNSSSKKQETPAAGSDSYALCLALVSVEPNVRRQCALLHKGMLECAGRMGQEGRQACVPGQGPANPQGQAGAQSAGGLGAGVQVSELQEGQQQQQQQGGQGQPHERQQQQQQQQQQQCIGLHSPWETQVAMECSLDLALRFVHVSCAANLTPAALQLLSQLQHGCRSFLASDLPCDTTGPSKHAPSHLPPPSNSSTPIAFSSPTAPSSTHLNVPTSILLEPPHHLQHTDTTSDAHPTSALTEQQQQHSPETYLHTLATTREGEGTKGQAAMVRALSRCPGLASMLWTCAAHVAQHGMLPTAVTRRLGYSQFPLLLASDTSYAFSTTTPTPSSQQQQPCQASNVNHSAAQPALTQPLAMSSEIWGHLEMALECACCAVEGVLAAAADRRKGSDVLIPQQQQQQQQQQQGQGRQQQLEQQQEQLPSAPLAPSLQSESRLHSTPGRLPETCIAAAAQLAAAMHAALSCQRSHLPPAPPPPPQASSQPQPQQPPQQQPHLPPSSWLTCLPLVTFWLAQLGSPHCAARLTSLPSHASHWLGPHYASALSTALHPLLPQQPSCAPPNSRPRTPPLTSMRSFTPPPSSSSQPSGAPLPHTLPHRTSMLLLSGVCLSAGLAAAAAATADDVEGQTSSVGVCLVCGL